MATSALDLLTALENRLDVLETTSLVPGSIPRVQQEWRALARAGLRLLEARPSHSGASAGRLGLLLGSMAAQPGEPPLPEPGTGLMGITSTIGCIADVVRMPALTSPETRELAGAALHANLEAALARAARWTAGNLRALDCAADTPMVRLAGLQGSPSWPPVLHAWRITGPTDPGIDGAVSRWANAATEVITSPHTVTQLALQLASADIALLCAAANAVTDRAKQAGHIEDANARTTTAALTAAGRAWRQTARWPSQVRLGGRSTQLREASADLRQSFHDTLRTGADWRRADELFAATAPEEYLAVLHSSLQTAMSVGRRVAAALHQLTHGASRVWLDASHIPAATHPTAQTLATIRYGWLPDPATYHSAEPLHASAIQALRKLEKATPLIMDALTRRPEPAGLLIDDGPWETVPLTLDPLRAAQERAKNASIAPSDIELPTRSLGR